ncbi:MAG: uroporphyrinogen-III synthase [Bacteroidales bacterium]|nr:uroporphyrinogen-III synthase [Bacteroidales bacterium]
MNLLNGKIIISTRPADADDTIAPVLKNEGAEFIDFPLIQIAETRKTRFKEKLLSKISIFDYVVFTSKNGVKYFFKYFENISKKNICEGITFISIGEKTSAEIRKYCNNTVITARGNTSDDFLDELKEIKIRDKKILLCLGTLAPDKIQKELSINNMVQRLNLYTTKAIQNLPENTIDIIKNRTYDVILFTSPSAIDNFVKIFKETGLDGHRIACIGNTTGQRAKWHNMQPVLISSKARGDIFAKELIEWLNINK